MSNLKIKEFRPSNYARKNWDSDGRNTSAGDRTYDPSRVFLSFEGETIYDNLNNRRQRPYNVIKPLLIEALKEAGIEYTKLRWSQKAGCRMCPCSPGFILEGNYGKDFWMTIIEDDTAYEPLIEIVSTV